ncbi:hypothetical protein O0I10_000614 [Lichtheimia ornata]|uniref:Gag1-like clamp domain-containing protein n=1 Tax=Lichtheimia ornata TaxID=688661 RepID=A0AAD8DIA1_9FUNG|nr:uncharacterized protein O0I10_000614 [Lichtheimia ornata]KAJ8663375.1 hypothetical protein O0I10_000614 [Lichtheimia ornata]
MSKDGEQAWHLRRQQWTQASDETLETKKQKAQELNDWYNDHLSTEKRLEMFHKTFVVKRVQTNKPVPLRFAVKMLIHGWKEDGTWPKGMEAPPASDEEGEKDKLL